MKSEGQREAIHGNKYNRLEEQVGESKIIFSFEYAEFIGICISIQPHIIQWSIGYADL